MRRLAALLLCLLACACSRDQGRAAFVQSRIPPSLSPRFYPPEGWAFGLVKAGKAPAQRYGVAAPVGLASRGDVLILSDYGESAEAWYETARDLTRRGWTVWVLERLGQGGSARYAGRRDLGHAVSLDPDVAATVGLIARIIRPAQGLVILGQGEGAATALRAARAGAKATGLILTSPLSAPAAEPSVQAWLRRFGLGGLRADARAVWRRDGPDGTVLGLTHDPQRGRVQMAWEGANPDLRMGGQSLDRLAAQRRAVEALRPSEVALPTLILQAAAGPGLCARIPHCTSQHLNGRADFYLETDAARGAWLSAVEGFVEARRAALNKTPPA